jgi:NADH dehydrogenase
VALESGHHAGDNIARLAEGSKTEPFRYFDKGTMATIGRGAAVMQGPHGRTMKGKSAWLAWGSVHLALLSTGEDRAKAVVDWAWALTTRERAARISVQADEK